MDGITDSVGFPDSSVGKEFAWNARYPGLIPGSGRSSGEGKGYPLHYSGLENSMDCTFQEFPKSWTRLSDFHFHVHYRASQVALVVKNPPAIAGDIRDSRLDPLGQEDPLEEQPTPVFLPGESHGQRSLAGYSPQSWTRLK